MRNKYYIVNVPPWGKVYNIVNLPGVNLLWGKVYCMTPALYTKYPHLKYVDYMLYMLLYLQVRGNVRLKYRQAHMPIHNFDNYFLTKAPLSYRNTHVDMFHGLIYNVYNIHTSIQI